MVIAIIGTLASVVLASLNSARAKARDASRLSQLKEVQKALDLYYSENGTYPVWVGGDMRENSCFGGGNNSDGVAQWDSALGVLVTDGFLPQLPDDPQNQGQVGGGNNPDFCFAYHRTSNSSNYNRCRNESTGDFYIPIDHEYLLYFSLENPDDHDITLHWNGNNSKPFNSCLPGPTR